MTFTQTQIRKLAGKLPERFVKTRSERGMTLSYVEGWHVIDEANRVFGFDGWDRETVEAQCVWQDGRLTPKGCSYAVRVRITVRAGKGTVSREGTGFGHGTGTTLGEAHESALKEAETDATKRALTTFGNLFGLALYDKERNGVERTKPRKPDVAPIALTLVAANEAPARTFNTEQEFCAAAKEALRQSKSLSELEALWKDNNATIALLRVSRPDLKTKRGAHYTEVLERLYRQQRLWLEHEAERREAPKQPSIDKSDLAFATPKRQRDSAHLKYVASLPCLVCGRSPAHAHHLRFVQPRAMGSKVSDEWTVPLCPIHHRALHDTGAEEEWWRAKRINARVEAEKLWAKSHGSATPVTEKLQDAGNSGNCSTNSENSSPTTASVEPLRASATNAQGQPVPINLHADRPRLD
jgi:DNA recombination protein Rad52